jgi:hypothetical protein
MSCPFFKPLRLADWGSGRAPLGGIFEGECEIEPTAGEPHLCNFGYARGACRHFPEATTADAVRFSVAGSEGDSIRIVWILEKDHAPLEHGIIEFRESTREFVDAPKGAMGVQARVFIETLLAH